MTGPLKMTLVGDKSFLKRHLENRSLEDELIKKIFSRNTRIFGKRFLEVGVKSCE